MKLDSLVRKRCRHSPFEWDLCSCSWFFHVTHERKKYGGVIPDVVSHDEARKKYQLIAANIRNGRPGLQGLTQPADGMTVAQLSEEWLSMPRDRKQSTIDSYRDHMRAHVLPVLGSKLVSEVTPEQCEALVTGLTRRRGEKPLSNETKQRIAVSVQALFSFAVRRRKRSDNPAAGLPEVVNDPDASPDDEVIDPKDHTRYFTEEEAAHLLHTLETKFPRWYLLVRTGIECGLRAAELVGLRFQDINWRGGYLTVRNTWVKGRSSSPKNRQHRPVSLSRELRAHLRLRWREHRDSERLVFTSPEGGRLDWANFRARDWRDILEAADLDYRTPHAMRHTHTSLLLQHGEHPTWVAAQAGRSLAVTMQVYAHFLPRQTGAAVDRLAGVLSGRTAKTHVSRRPEPAAVNGHDRLRSDGRMLRVV
jgi:integrase